jgi:transcriptional regulator with XRE-family HTH domain
VADLNLRSIRKAAGLTQVELAKAAFISQPLVVKIECGYQKPSVKVAKRIAKVLGFDWTLFFE